MRGGGGVRLHSDRVEMFRDAYQHFKAILTGGQNAEGNMRADPQGRDVEKEKEQDHGPWANQDLVFTFDGEKEDGEIRLDP